MSALGPPQHAVLNYGQSDPVDVYGKRFRPCFDAPRSRVLARVAYQLSLGLVDVITLVESHLPRY